MRRWLPSMLLVTLLAPMLTGAGFVTTTFDGWRRVHLNGTGPLPEVPEGASITIDPRLIDVTLAELLEGVEIRTSDLVDARISSFYLESEDDLSYFSAVEIWALEGLRKERLAARYAFPPGTFRADLALDDVNLASFVTEPTTRIIAVVNGLPPEADTKLFARYTLKFGLTASGACYALSARKAYEASGAADDTGL